MKALALLALVLVATAAEPLVCRGFPAAAAADAISGRTGRLSLFDPAFPGAGAAVWFALPQVRRDTAAQALAHATGSWWEITSDDQLRLGTSPRLVPGRQSARSLTSTLIGRLEAERIARRLMDPWLGGDGGLVLDPVTGAWTAVLDDDAHARLTTLIGLLGSGEARAPHLLPDPDDPGPAHPLTAAPHGRQLGEWAVDLAAVAGLAIAVGPDCDPTAPAPTWNATTLGEVRDHLAADGIASAVVHGCLCLSRRPPQDRQHPAQRCQLAQIPVGQLCRNAADLERLAAWVTARIAPGAWAQPGWGVVPVGWTRCLLVSADIIVVHEVMAEVDRLDAMGRIPQDP